MTTTEALNLAIHLMARDSDALGFIPRARLEQRAQLGQLLTCTENGDGAGYILIGRPREWLHIHQCCVAHDARRLQHGTELLHQALAIAARHACHGVSLRCAAELPAVQFWQSLGFRTVFSTPGGLRRRRTILTMQRELPTAFPLFQPLKSEMRNLNPECCAHSCPFVDKTSVPSSLRACPTICVHLCSSVVNPDFCLLPTAH